MPGNDLARITARINEFRDERQWRQFHNPKDLALSISIEAAELLECFQWVSPEQATAARSEEIRDELADVLIYAFTLAAELEVDIETIILEKLEKSGAKYPVATARGIAGKAGQAPQTP